MSTEADFLGRPVYSLQTMLRTISFQNSAIPRVVPDGIFGKRTLESVKAFQQEYGLPVTGTVDAAVWDTIAAAYQDAVLRLTLPRPANLFPAFFPEIRPGQHSAYLYPIQGMFRGLSLIFADMEPCEVDGIHAGASVYNTSWLQERCALEPTGVFDHVTWNFLARLYDSFVMRNPDFPDKELIRPPI